MAEMCSESTWDGWRSLLRGNVFARSAASTSRGISIYARGVPYPALLGLRPCPYPAKGTLENGKPACGRHLAGERRREANRERIGREIEEEAAAAERREALRDAEKLVLHEAVVWNSTRTSYPRGTEMLVAAIDALEELREREVGGEES